MAQSARAGLDELLRERVAAGAPLLGICLGMQLLFDAPRSTSGADGPRADRRRRCGALARRRLKLPHIGWSEVRFGCARRR